MMQQPRWSFLPARFGLVALCALAGFGVVLPPSSAEEVEEEMGSYKRALRWEGRREEELEEEHRDDSLTLLLACALLGLVVITVWIFKMKRFRVLHETGFSLIYGIVVGLIMRYSGTRESIDPISCKDNSTHPPKTVYLSYKNDTYAFGLKNKLFKDDQGTTFESMLLFKPETFFFVLLPPIIFFAGYDLRRKYFFRNIGAILLYAFAGTTISCFVIGTLMYAYTQMNIETLPVGVDNLVECLIFGALISATDPVTVLAIFHDLHVDVDLFAMVFGESVLNDAVAIVLYRSISLYSPANEAAIGIDAGAIFKSIGLFMGIFVGSFVIGVLFGLVTALFTKLTRLREFPLLESGFFCLMSYATFLTAEAFELTGIVAILFCGITQAHYTYFNLSEESKRTTKEFFGMLNFLAENFVFIYMGLALFTFRYHQWCWGFIAWSFVAITAGRVLNILPLSFIANLKRKNKISLRFQKMLLFSGLRGAIAFALAMRNTSSEVRQLFLTTTLMIVFVTVFFNGGTTTMILEKLKIEVGVKPEPDADLAEDNPEGFQGDSEIGLVSSSSRFSQYAPTGAIRVWTNFDRRFVRPIFTSRGPPLTEVFSHRFHWLARFLTAPKVLEQDEGLVQSTSEDDVSAPGRLSFHETDEQTTHHQGVATLDLEMSPFAGKPRV